MLPTSLTERISHCFSLSLYATIIPTQTITLWLSTRWEAAFHRAEHTKGAVEAGAGGCVNTATEIRQLPRCLNELSFRLLLLCLQKGKTVLQGLWCEKELFIRSDFDYKSFVRSSGVLPFPGISHLISLEFIVENKHQTHRFPCKLNNNLINQSQIALLYYLFSQQCVKILLYIGRFCV